MKQYRQSIAVAIAVGVFIAWLAYLSSRTDECERRGGTFFPREFKCLDVKELR